MSYRPRSSGPTGPFSGANLPYSMAIVVSLALLIPFLLFADPFASGEAAASGTTGATVTTGGNTATTTATTGTTVDPGTTSTTVGESTTVPSNLTGAAADGEALFAATCVVCHGPAGVGIEGLGKPLTTSTFADGLSDAELLAFLVAGRPSDDPLNTTGIAMPPRGGNSALTDDDLADIVAYLRTLGA